MVEQHGKTLVPQIRFAGFTDPWEQRKLGDILQERNVRTSDFESNPIFSLTIEDGITPKTDRYERTSLITKTEDLFKIVSPNEFVTNPMNLRFGAFGYNKNSFSVCVSGYYDVFSIDNDKCSGFWNSYFKTSVALKRFDDAATGSLIEKRRVKYSTLCQLIFLMPKGMDEKKRIGAFFDRLDSLITLHQRKYDKLCVLKKSMLDKMFPKGGSLYPEIRFAGFTDPWEQRKLSELVEIERGGSPRPIERYITDDPCGLNWVKIGDAPELGRYITQTTEKIKPEGLAKTRQVYPGDLVLSNSMSFGRPYIMAIRGCIHDGWLLIRDAQKHFDPIFLCHMLGAPQMLNQYRMFAAGSTVNNLNKELVGKAIVSLPSKDEQREIGIVLDRLDSLITLHQRKLELLRNIKKSMLDKMFV
ncbi:restriction endonuclease subunit S [Bifidobacterium adolescentis]|uniref:restriction endonuclease subunit S n=2 Tax=Bifidobacterium adolescentis TaxID=1680 RepID=UPI001AE8EB83|nr:restriction endonuclease subunit S [Bifidobacterium adolescentis]